MPHANLHRVLLPGRELFLHRVLNECEDGLTAFFLKPDKFVHRQVGVDKVRRLVIDGIQLVVEFQKTHQHALKHSNCVWLNLLFGIQEISGIAHHFIEDRIVGLESFVQILVV